LCLIDLIAIFVIISETSNSPPLRCYCCLNPRITDKYMRAKKKRLVIEFLDLEGNKKKLLEWKTFRVSAVLFT